jgi:hypothetical protein
MPDAGAPSNDAQLRLCRSKHALARPPGEGKISIWGPGVFVIGRPNFCRSIRDEGRREARASSGPRRLALKLNIAFFRNRRLFNCNHLTLHLR